MQSAKYLGIIIKNSLDWGQHISKITLTATRTLGFLRRNLTFAKAAAYIIMIRPQLQYAAPIWHPYVKTQAQQVEKVKRMAARRTCTRWRDASSVGYAGGAKMAVPGFPAGADLFNLSYDMKAVTKNKA